MPNGTYGGVRGKETSRKENHRFPTYSIAKSKDTLILFFFKHLNKIICYICR